MNLRTPILGITLLVAVSACSSGHAPDASAGADNPAAASTAMPASNPLTPLLNTRNRAQAVQQKLQAHDQAERKALEDAQK